jgi:stage IV sporulation protein FB
MPEWMSDPMSWAIPIGRYFGIRVRIHIFFLIFALPQCLNALREESIYYFWFEVGLTGILFFSVLLHEFGHCFAARAVGGDAEEILMWPLGGLATVSAPNTARAQFIVTVWGPLVNVMICLASAVVLVSFGLIPALNPFSPPPADTSWLSWVGVTFFVNWLLLLFNLIPAFPMDGGRIFRCMLWNRLGLGRATLYAVQVAKVCAIAMGTIGFIEMLGDSKKPQGLLLIAVAYFVYRVSDRERQLVEAGVYADDSVFGYDFSQGYLSLDKSAPKPAKARPMSAWERWWRKRERLKRQREVTAQQEQERRVDQILEKLHRDGMASLSDQEKRFLTRASEKYRSRDRT